MNFYLRSAICTIFIVLTYTAELVAFGSDGTTTREFFSRGVGLGTAIAVVASWSRNSSVLWAILHGVFGWLYVIYFAITREEMQEQQNT